MLRLVMLEAVSSMSRGADAQAVVIPHSSFLVSGKFFHPSVISFALRGTLMRLFRYSILYSVIADLLSRACAFPDHRWFLQMVSWIALSGIGL